MNLWPFALFLSWIKLVGSQGAWGGSYFDEQASVYNYDAFGVKFAANDRFSVLIQNDQRQFIISFAPYGPNATNCTFDYQFPGYEYMYMVAVAMNTSAGYTRFLNIGESFQGGLPFVETIIFDETCSNVTFANKQNLQGGNINVHSDYYEITLESQGRFAIGFHPVEVFIYDLDTYLLTEFPATQYWSGPGGYAGFQATYWPFIPYECGMTEEFAVVVGYIYDPDTLRYVPTVYLFTVDLVHMNISLVDSRLLIDYALIYPYEAATYSLENGMSVSMHSSKQLLLIGIPKYDQVIIVEFNSTNQLYFTKRLNFANGLNVLYGGKAVAWIDDQTAAVLFYALATDPWSVSQVQVFNIDTALAMPDDSSLPLPVYTFPNNQVTVAIPLRLTNFIHIVSWSYNLAVLTIDGYVLFLPASPPGTYGSPYSTKKVHLFYYYTPIPCLPGMFKTTIGFQPCALCPPQTFSTTGGMATSCISCNSESFCPLGAINDLQADNLTTVTQVTAYPSNPELTSFDDIIMQTMFTIGSTQHCMRVSPIFWTSIMMGLAVIILIGIIILHFAPKWKSHRVFVKRFFRQLDLIGEGELWVGGLVSCAIIVMIAFGYRFSVSFIQLYPIETSDEASFTCNKNLRNAKFSSGLQLLSIPRSDEEQPIFDLLENQNFTMTVDFIQTIFDCRNVSAQWNINTNHIPLDLTTCQWNNETVTLAVSIVLPVHVMTIQYNLAGMASVGGARICLFGSAASSNDSSSYVQNLGYCQFFFTPNQTLAQTSVINLELTRIVNRTEPLSGNDRALFNGLWQLTPTVETISDQLLYEKNGDYLRYLAVENNLIVQLTESSFYMKNIQEPIARETEIIFHSFLFTTMALELFGLVFVIFKLIILPLFSVAYGRLGKNRIDVFNDEESDPHEKNYHDKGTVFQMDDLDKKMPAVVE